MYVRAFILWFDTLFSPGRDGASRVAGQDGYGRGGCDRAAAADADEVETGVIVTEEGIEEREENFSTRPFRKGMHWKQVL